MNQPFTAWRFARLTAFLITLLVFLTICSFLVSSGRRFVDDDAYMFYRYALNVYDGRGISWNADGLPTYGITSLPWLAVVLLLVKVPFSATTVLLSVSCGAFLTAAAAMVIIVIKNSKSPAFRDALLVVPVLLLPLLLHPTFDANIVNGMETMLSLFGNVLLVGAALRVQRSQRVLNYAVLGFAGYLAFLIRPDNGLCAALLPVLIWLLWRPRYIARAVIAETCLFVPIAIQLGLAFSYFGTPLPLPFYVKSLHGYKGYLCPVNSGSELASFAEFVAPFLLVIFGLSHRFRQWRFVSVFLIPVLLICGYLLSVIQVVGSNARYYVPFLPFILVPACLVLDRLLTQYSFDRIAIPWLHCVASAVLIGAGLAGIRAISDAYAHRTVVLYPEPKRIIAAKGPLGELQELRCTVGDSFARSLPAGTVLAASEVGCLGYAAPQVSIIDLVGLNDQEIALRGFNVDRLLARQPDVIWLPHTDYTWHRYEFWTDPAFLLEYNVYDQAFDYGIAIRRKSARYTAVTSALSRAWSRDYPGMPQQEYLVLGLGS
jgi:hypothetical protein